MNLCVLASKLGVGAARFAPPIVQWSLPIFCYKRSSPLMMMNPHVPESKSGVGAARAAAFVPIVQLLLSLKT
jgi:hypothetical protein